MGGPGRAQDLNYLNSSNYSIPGPELNNLNNLNIWRGGPDPPPGPSPQYLNYLNYLIEAGKKII